MPEPTTLVLLQQLHTLPDNTKVRFLGCVHDYSLERAQLTLRTRYPATNPEEPWVIVDIRNVLESVNHELLQVGAWLNVMGNVFPSADAKPEDGRSPPVFVTAAMIWSAGAIQLEKYEASVKEYQTPSEKE